MFGASLSQRLGQRGTHSATARIAGAVVSAYLAIASFYDLGKSLPFCILFPRENKKQTSFCCSESQDGFLEDLYACL